MSSMISLSGSSYFDLTLPTVRELSLALALGRSPNRLVASASLDSMSSSSSNNPPPARNATNTISISSLLNEEDSRPDAPSPSSPSVGRRAIIQPTGGEAVPVTYIRRNDADITKLKMLRDDENITLFTPLIPPLRPTQQSQGQAPASGSSAAPTATGSAPAPASAPPMDPFEPLGRALSQHHRRIRHCPYVPERQMTETHLAFLRDAHAVIVVVCDAVGAATSQRSSLESQVAFARGVHQQASAVGHAPPVVLILVTEDLRGEGAAAGVKESLIGEFGAGTILHCGSYSADALTRIANRIFEEDTFERVRDQQADADIEMD